MIQHYVQAPTGVQNIASMYRVGWKDVAIATFGKWGASWMYPWLEQNAGHRGARDSTTPTGYHWSFATGMVVNVPAAGPSISPVTWVSVPAPRPGGPLVDVAGTKGSPLPGRELAQQPVQESDEPAEEPEVSSARVSDTTLAATGGGIMWVLILGVVAFKLFGGMKKRRRTTRRKRKTTKRRRR